MCILLEIFMRSSDLLKDRWEIGHVKWMANGAAHGLAKAAIREKGENVRIEETLNVISEVALICLEFVTLDILPISIN